MKHVTPLPGGFMIIGMFGFLFATLFLGNYSLNWAFIVGTMSIIVFAASMISMTKAPVEEELLLDEHTSERARRVKVYTLKEYKAHKELLAARHKREKEALEENKPVIKSKKVTTKKASKKTTSTKKRKGK